MLAKIIGKECAPDQSAIFVGSKAMRMPGSS
jgi:hypothetical protein